MDLYCCVAGVFFLLIQLQYTLRTGRGHIYFLSLPYHTSI